MLDKNNITIQIGDIVKIENSPIKADNATYIIAQDGTSNMYNAEDLTLYKVAKHKEGYSLSRSSYNICFYPLCNFSNKYKYTKEEMRAATIEVLIKADSTAFNIIKIDDRCEQEETEQTYFYATVKKDNEKIEDVSYSLVQKEKLVAFFSNITLKQGETIEIEKRDRNWGFYRSNIKYELERVIQPATNEEEPNEESTEKETIPEETGNEEEGETMNSKERIYYPINESTARSAKHMNSFSEYKEGEATEEYKYYCDKVYNILDQIREQKPILAEKAEGMTDRYCKKLAEYYNDYYRNETSCPSIMISGGSNFPVRKKEKQNSRRKTLMDTWNYLQDYAKKIENLLTQEQPILSKDENAIQLLIDKITTLEETKETMKAINKYYKQNGTIEGFTGIVTKESINHIEFMEKQGWNKSGTIFDTTNTNAEIKRLQARLENLQKAKEQGTTEQTTTDSEGNELFKVVENVEIMRLQLLFDGKPDEETRNILKKNGFKWSPKNEAWQRQLTDNARISLKRIVEQLKIA